MCNKIQPAFYLPYFVEFHYLAQSISKIERKKRKEVFIVLGFLYVPYEVKLKNKFFSRVLDLTPLEKS